MNVIFKYVLLRLFPDALYFRTLRKVVLNKKLKRSSTPVLQVSGNKIKIRKERYRAILPLVIQEPSDINIQI